MSVKALLENSLFSKLAMTIAASAMIGGGTMVLNSQTRLSVLESMNVQESARLERIENKIDHLLER